jgi:triacylglycerol lipase
MSHAKDILVDINLLLYATVADALIPFFSIGCTSTPLLAQIASKKNEYVLLLHGLSRSRFSMYFLGAYLQNQGFKVLNIGYPSTKYPIEQLVKNVAEQIKKGRIESANKIHFVTHSLGGIITRLYLKENQPENLGRVVMLSPPNQGSELTDSLKNNLLYQWITGPAGQQLGTEPSSMPNQLGTVNFELGVITGNTSLNPIYSYLIPGDDDGKVSVKRAQVEGMKDFLVVPHSHSFIMNSRFVREQIVYFLDQGKFRRLPKETE